MVQSCLLSAWQLWQDSREFVDCLNEDGLVLPRAARKSGSIDGQGEFASIIGAPGMHPLMDRDLSLPEKLGRSVGGDSYIIRAIDRPLIDYHRQHSQPVFLVEMDSRVCLRKTFLRRNASA